MAYRFAKLPYTVGKGRNQMADIPLINYRNIRLEKVEKLREMGINPYLSKCSRTHYSDSVVKEFENLEGGQDVIVAGRLMSWRPHGKLTFCHVQDQNGKIQILLHKKELGETDLTLKNLGYSDLKLLDVGDFIEITGSVMKTQKGEISVLAKTLKMLAKSIRPLPDKWSGLKDREAILRRRYLDTTMKPENKEHFEAIARMLFATRKFLDDRGFLEFTTPVLQPQYGGGTAKPFITTVNALDCDMYLSISHELYLKRLIAAGFDKVYTIGKYFRNEGIDKSHHPEFSMIETMTAYENYEYNMDLIEDLFRYIAEKAFGKTEFTVQGNKVDFGKPWKRISMIDAVLEVTGTDFRKFKSVAEANEFLATLESEEPVQPQASIGHALAAAFEICVEPTLVEPTLLYGHPMEISPLAKPMDDDPNFAERFEIFIGGMECGDNWSEQNDPVPLLKRWKEDYRRVELNPEEFHPLDLDFVEVLEYGMPPTTGIGPGIERMAMIFAEKENIDDVIFFPMMKPHVSPMNAIIYEVDKLENLPEKGEEEKEINLSIDDFSDLVSEEVLTPAPEDIVIYPHLRIWGKPSGKGQWKASGYMDIRGFLKNKKVRVVGYSTGSAEKLDIPTEKESFKTFIEKSINETICKYSGKEKNDVKITEVKIIS
jgi:lysyl-tRNA synthetase class 2